MKKIAFIIGAIVFTITSCSDNKNSETQANEQKPTTAVVSKRSDVYNKSVEDFLNAYYAMSEAFVNWDTAAVRSSSANFKTALDNYKIDELKTDSIIYGEAERIWNAAKSETAAIAGDNDLAEQRGSLNILSQALYNLLSRTQYDKAKVYFQECPMAFNDVNAGNWLSSQSAVRNPYLGTSHPKYHSGMLKCGGTKDSINFVSK
jgi:hypothetical protein